MNPSSLSSLFIKQSAILEVLQEHGMQNFNELKRKFMGMNKFFPSEKKERTLRYHLKKLQDKGFVRKRGATKGVFYETID